ncbi:MAG: P1 family peptidase [Rhodothalassiaceae bacterium]
MTDVPVRPGATDSFCDVDGLALGHAEDRSVLTGVTVVLPDQPIVMAVDVRGGGPGTRETDALAPDCLVQRVHGLVLSGGSVFGLAAADAVVSWLSARGIGLPIAPRPVPVVPAAVLFDLRNGGDKAWTRSPYPGLAEAACAAADASARHGPIGAGLGARCGARAGGLGSASLVGSDGPTVSALAVVNAFGQALPAAGGPAIDPAVIPFPKAGLIGTNTTLGVVATDLALDKAAAKRLAVMAQDGLARALRPIHTPFDGDTVFAVATGARAVAPADLAQTLALAGTMAADAMVRAIAKALSAPPAG